MSLDGHMVVIDTAPDPEGNMIIETRDDYGQPVVRPIQVPAGRGYRTILDGYVPHYWEHRVWCPGPIVRNRGKTGE